MGQVPEIIYGIVGDGRVARHFSNYFRLINIPFKNWTRTSRQNLDNCTVILLLISDSQIEKFYKENLKWLEPKTVVHFSGSLSIKSIYGFHPLMTFATDLYDLETYKKIVFIGERDSIAFERVFPKLENKHFYIPKESKPLYHAFCVMSGNFSVILWQKLFSELSHRWDIPKDAALPYLQQITENLISNSPSALTGPLQRGDLITIEKNRDALKADPKFLKIYDAFVEAYL